MADNRPESQLIEEQTLPFYEQKRYYPVRIGSSLRDQYRIVAKLGFGAYSTVWLARDERWVLLTHLGSSNRAHADS